MKKLALLAAVLACALALAADRLLPFSPLADAKAGETATYRIDILDAGGKKVSSSERTFKIDSIDDGDIVIGRYDLRPDSDAPALVQAMGLLPRGTPTTGMAAKAGKDGKVTVTHKATLQDGQTTVEMEALFDEKAPLFGVRSARTKIVGGGAGESVYELIK